MAKPAGASPGQAAFIGSASPTLQQVSWHADHGGAAPSHVNTQWQCGPLPAHSDRIARDFHPVPYHPRTGGTLRRLSHYISIVCVCQLYDAMNNNTTCPGVKSVL